MKTTTLVLVGKTGNGKSATGNSILGGKPFESVHSFAGVTQGTKKCVSMVNDRLVQVIDTPGLFDTELDPLVVQKEIAKCIDIAKNGIDGILIVLSLRNRFSDEESQVLQTIQGLFGENIAKYAVVIFTNGDVLDEDEDEDAFLRDRLSESPPTLKTLLEDCKSRYVVFDNKIKDKEAKAKQLSKLLKLVDGLVEQNGGRPYSSDLFKEAKKREKMNPKERIESEAKVKDEIERRLKETMCQFQNQMQKIQEEMMRRDNVHREEMDAMFHHLEAANNPPQAPSMFHHLEVANNPPHVPYQILCRNNPPQVPAIFHHLEATNNPPHVPYQILCQNNPPQVPAMFHHLEATNNPPHIPYQIPCRNNPSRAPCVIM